MLVGSTAMDSSPVLFNLVRTLPVTRDVLYCTWKVVICYPLLGVYLGENTVTRGLKGAQKRGSKTQCEKVSLCQNWARVWTIQQGLSNCISIPVGSFNRFLYLSWKLAAPFHPMLHHSKFRCPPHSLIPRGQKLSDTFSPWSRYSTGYFPLYANVI